MGSTAIQCHRACTHNGSLCRAPTETSVPRPPAPCTTDWRRAALKIHGTYRALWNRGHDSLIGITATGLDRGTLIDVADQLVLDNTTTGYQADLELIA